MAIFEELLEATHQIKEKKIKNRLKYKSEGIVSQLKTIIKRCIIFPTGLF